MIDWKQIWSKRKISVDEEDLVHSLMLANGFDDPVLDYSKEHWNSMVIDLVESIGIKRGSRVLDVGCGAGGLAYAIKKLTDADVFGYDYSPTLIKLARRYCAGEFKVSDAKRSPFPSDSFDHVICHSVFQYFENFDYACDTLREMLRCLSPGGWIVVMDLNDVSLRDEYEKVRYESKKNELKDSTKFNEDSGHMFYKQSEIMQIMTHLGVIDVQTTAPVAGRLLSKYRFNVRGKKCW